MYFYTIDDKDLYSKLGLFTGIKWFQNHTFLKYKTVKQEPILEANGHYIMYVVDDDSRFEQICLKHSVRFTKLPVNEDEYLSHFAVYYKGKIQLNEELTHKFDDLEKFIKLIAAPNETLIITDRYSFRLTDDQIDKISEWILHGGICQIEFAVPLDCVNKMNSIAQRFKSNGVTVSFVNRDIHGRYWIVKDKGFLRDASVNTNGASFACILEDGDLQDIKLEYNL